MRCVHAMKLLQLYIDNQLTLKQIHALEMHLSSCVGCQEELFLLEKITHALRGINSVVEPADLTENIMQRVAFDAQRPEKAALASTSSFCSVARPFRPSLAELLTVVVLATVTTLGIILGQPSLRESLPFANGHDTLSLFFISLFRTLMSINNGTLTFAFWIVGTLLGVCITLALAGQEIRDDWFKAISHRLPVW